MLNIPENSDNNNNIVVMETTETISASSSNINMIVEALIKKNKVLRRSSYMQCKRCDFKCESTHISGATIEKHGNKTNKPCVFSILIIFDYGTVSTE